MASSRPPLARTGSKIRSSAVQTLRQAGLLCGYTSLPILIQSDFVGLGCSFGWDLPSSAVEIP